jgi:RHS repeat-associated protein
VARSPRRRWLARGRRVVALAVSPLVVAGTSLTPAVVTAGAVAAAVAAVAVAKAPAAHAASGPSVAVVLVNGESSAPETALLQAAGDTVTQITPATLAAMSQATFDSYAAIVIGDSSTSSSCSTTAPSTATLGSQWEGWVTGNVAVLGTAPARPGTSGADALIKDAVAYAAQQPSSGSSTGLYLSLNCGYATAASGTAVSLLAGVDGIGGDGGVTVNGSLTCTDTGTVNSWEAGNAGTFGGFSSTSLGTGSTGFPSPSCPVEEAFDSWPAMFTPVGYDSGSDAAKNFTASDGVTGQPYLLLGTPPASQATDALDPTVGGQVPEGTSIGGASPAASGVSQALAAGSVNTENGDLTQSQTDLSIPGYGPSLAFTRTYDADLAQAQTETGTPGPLGYGSTDNWATALAAGRLTPADIYTVDGLETDNGNGGPATSGATDDPSSVWVASTGTYIADTADNRILEVPSSSGTQWGISMTAGDIYTIAGSSSGTAGESASGTKNTSSLLDQPAGLAMDSSGDLFIADSGNNRVLELAASTDPWGAGSDGIPATAVVDDLYLVAGTGTAGVGSDSKPAYESALHWPVGIFIGGNAGGSLYIADADNNRIQMISQIDTTHWGVTMTTPYDVYTVLGSSAGTSGDSGNGTLDTSAKLSSPRGMTIDSSGNLYVTDTLNNRVIEVPKATGAQWGDGTMTLNDLYTIAGSTAGTTGTTGDGALASSALLDNPKEVTWASPNLYITDALNNRIQEIAGSTHSEFGQSMTEYDIYTIAGSATGGAGNSGDGGAATAALLSDPASLALNSGNLYLTDTSNDEVREVSSSTYDISDFAGGAGTFQQDGDGGPAVDAGLDSPDGVATDAQGDIFIADTYGNRVQEISVSSHTQFGISMKAGDVYTVAGTDNGVYGTTGDGGPATQATMEEPYAVTVDSAGDLYIADGQGMRVQEVPASTGTQWGQSMTAGYMYTVAGQATEDCGNSGQGGPATSALFEVPSAVATDAAGDLFIEDAENNQVYVVPKTSGTHYGIAMTADYLYTIAGSTAATAGDSGDGGSGTSALLNDPDGLAVDPAGNVYVSDGGNDQIREIAAVTSTQHGQAMTAGDIYTIAGSTAGTAGNTGDGGPAASALLHSPGGLSLDGNGDLYVIDDANNRIREIAAQNGTQWGQQMTAGDIYNVAGSSAGTAGESGDGAPATSALMTSPAGIATDPAGDIFVTDSGYSRLREIAAGSNPLIPTSPAAVTVTVTNADGSQTSFGPQTGGSCTSPYVTAGGYCTLPANTGASLTLSSGTYTYTPSAGANSYTYNSSGQLTAETDTAGDKLTITYSSPAPGGTVTGNGTCPSTATSCETITAASGRALILGWNGTSDTGQITSVTDPMNRTWTYGYTSSDLTSVTDPLSNKTTYSYGAGSNGPLQANDLLTITAPDAQSGYSGPDADPGADTSITYNSFNEVTQQTDPMGWKTTFNYCVNAVAGDCLNSATGNGFVTVSDPDGNNTVYDYAQGTLAAQSAWTGTVGSTLTSENDSVPDTTAASSSNLAGGSLEDTSATNGDGQTSTSTYDAAGNATSATSPGANGTAATTTSNYTLALQDANCTATAEASSTDTCNDGASPPSAVAPGGVITPPSAAPPDGVTYSLYDTDGNELYTTTGVYSPAGTYEYSRTTYQLFKGNSVTLNSTNISCTYTPPSVSLPCALINADGVVTQQEYDSAGDLELSSTPDGNYADTQASETTYTYNADGEQLTKVAPDGNLSGANAGNYTTTTAWTTDNEQASVTQGNGSGYTDTPRTTAYTYDGDGNEAKTEDARGYTTTTTFNADDQATLVKNPDSDSTLTCYDGDGNTVQTVPPVGVAANSLTAASCPTSYPSGYSDRLATDATVSTVNAARQMTSQTAPAPAGQSGYETTTYTYDGAGNVLTTTAPPTTSGGGNQVTVDTYDAAGQLATQTTGSGTSAASTVSYCYDPNADKTAVVYGDGNTTGAAACETSSPWVVPSSDSQAAYQTTYGYDSAGDLTSTVTPANSASSAPTTTATYDPAGNMLTRTDPDGVITSYAYTPLNQESGVGYSLTSSASVAGTPEALVSQVPETGASLCLDDYRSLTTAGNIIDIYGCNQSSAQLWTPNANGTLEVLGNCLDVSGNGTSSGSLIVLEPCSGGTPGEIWHAGNNGSWVNPNSGMCLDDPSSTTTQGTQVQIYGCNGTNAQDWASAQYTFDASGNKVQMGDATGTSTWGFDSFGEETSAENGAGQTTTYGYNADGDTTGITYPLPATATWATTDTVSYGYDNADELTSLTDFNGKEISIGNTADGLPNSVGLGSSADTIATTYDNTDNPSVIALKNASSTLQSFTYSDSQAGTVLSETDTPTSSYSPADYTYDAKGRVTSMTPGTGSAKDYGFDASGNLTTLPTGATGSYNDAGELTSSALSGTSTNYTYNGDGEQLTSVQGSTTESSAAWNGAGQLATYTNSAANMTAATYNGNGVRASTTITPAGGSAVTQNYVWNAVPQVPELLMDGTNAYIYDGGGTPAEQVNLSTGTIAYLVTDALGSVRGTVSSTGSLTGTTSYDAWGNPETAGGLTATTPFGYAGGYTDPDGLVYLLNRYYQPSTGQFISVDPDLAQTLAAYEYASGDPVTNTDPSGLWSGWNGKVCSEYASSSHHEWWGASYGQEDYWCTIYLDNAETERITSDLDGVVDFLAFGGGVSVWGGAANLISKVVVAIGRFAWTIAVILWGLRWYINDLNRIGGHCGIYASFSVDVYWASGWGYHVSWAWPFVGDIAYPGNLGPQ